MEATFILPLILLCICIAVETGVALHQEVQMLVEEQAEQKTLDMVKTMYRREYIKELFGAFYED